jgi:hypothetical protein
VAVPLLSRGVDDDGSPIHLSTSNNEYIFHNPLSNSLACQNHNKAKCRPTMDVAGASRAGDLAGWYSNDGDQAR